MIRKARRMVSVRLFLAAAAAASAVGWASIANAQTTAPQIDCHRPADTGRDLQSQVDAGCFGRPLPIPEAAKPAMGPLDNTMPKGYQPPVQAPQPVQTAKKAAPADELPPWMGGSITSQQLTDVESECKSPNIVSTISTMVERDHQGLRVLDTFDPGVNPAWRATHYLPGEATDRPNTADPTAFYNSMRNIQQGQENPTCAVTLMTNRGERKFVYGSKVVHGTTYVQGRFE